MPRIEVTGTHCAKNIRYLRKKYSVSLRGLERLMGMNVFTLKEIEEERRSAIFEPQQLKRLCEIFGMPLEDIVHKDLSPDLDRK